MALAKRYKAALNLFLSNFSSDRQKQVRVLKVYSGPKNSGQESDIKIDFVVKEKEGYLEKAEFDRGFANEIFSRIRDEEEFIRLVVSKRRRFTVVVRPPNSEDIVDD